jgi:hypothetical protein
MYEVYSPPITTRYSQVWWAPLDPVDFPKELIQKYENRSMAIVGWEIDQVVRGNTSENDISVPINANYNHHYVGTLIGGDAEYKKIKLSGPNDPRVEMLRNMGHGRIAFEQPQYVVEKGTSTTHILFSSANGGEYRKTYHGFAPSYVLKLDSPKQMQITPMQIDTWNRDEMKFHDKLTSFVPGPLPRASQAPKDASYSGLLECPMTTRLERVVDTTYFISDNSCQENETILSMEQCLSAMSDILEDQHVILRNQTIHSEKLPPRCSARMYDGVADVYFNLDSFAGSNHCRNDDDGDDTVLGETKALNISLNVRVDTHLTNITLIGPSSVWFGVGFDAQNMGDEPYTIVVDGTGSVTERKLGNHQAGTLLNSSVTVISSTVQNNRRTIVLSRPSVGDTYTFKNVSKVMNLIFAVGSSSSFSYVRHHTLHLDSLLDEPTHDPRTHTHTHTKQHKFRTPSKITFLSTSSSCVCSAPPPLFGKATGSLVYHANESQPADVGTGSVSFGSDKCRPWPYSQLLDFQNPTCDVRTYRGGQWACHHMWSLLDADQEIPWSDKPLVMHHKYRFWVQPYDENYHTQLFLGEFTGSPLLIGSPWELDVPVCTDKIPGCTYSKETGWVHTIKGNCIGERTFAALNFHCHAPTCLSMEVWACDRNVSLENCNDTIGTLLCREKPVHGSGINESDKFDELGYIAIPDCFWGDSEFGLESPINVTGLPLHVVKRSNATIGHYGEMAGGQPWVI